MDLVVVVVGDEILAGHVQDANAYFIATRAVATGHRVRRIAVVGDEPDAIAAEIRAAVGEGTELIMVCGGLGPTHDDRTMEGVAQALEVPLQPSPVLRGWIDLIIARVEQRGVSAASWGFDSLRKMELAPAGAEVLASRENYIPVVVSPIPSGHLVVLPGPPRELQAVFGEHVEPRFLAGTGAESISEEIRHPFFESTVAEVLADLQGRYPATSVGSYPQADHTLVRIAGPPADVRAAASALRAHLEAFSASDEGGRLLEFIDERRARRDAAQAP